MSSVCAIPPTKQRERSTPTMEWGERTSVDFMEIEIKDSGSALSNFPITVDDGNLKIASTLLEIGRVYCFEYLGSQMALWKSPNGAVELFEILEE